ncbi:pyrroline-5-carboxylate reductase [Salicola sp. Rm-C-2C1-2]|uniref:pyrroline-5-carboxylate reductase n=1 Tax=Salicola sp. Rm-C-2C1-2 TaxID=3141321 RepID=UPI0032E4A8FA
MQQDSQQPAISFIGAGNMARAILGGLVANGYDPTRIWASAPEDSHLQGLRDDFGIYTTTDNRHCASQADILILAVKPQVMAQACQDIASVVRNTRPLAVSIAAGLDSETISGWLGGDVPVVRCMPNTPSLVGKGASALYATESVSRKQREAVTSIFSSIGLGVWLEEEQQMHAVTALSGSGPAYCYLLVESMETAAVDAGVPPETARQLAIQTMAGAAQMCSQGDEAPDQLRRNVMSPGGTTEQAVEALESGGLRGIVAKAFNAAKTRSAELSEQLRKAL